MSKKDFSVALKYVEARPRSQRRKGAEARVSGISVVGSGVSATDLSLLQANLISVTNNFTALKDLFDSMFEKDSDNNIHAKLSLWSSGGITAGGAGSGGSGGGISYNRLDSWADYSADKSGWVLSALLGKDLDSRVSALANAGYVTASALAPYALRSEIPSLDGYATEAWIASQGYITQSALTPYFLISSFTKANIKSTLGISDWALASTKPTYTASEVGALSVNGTAQSALKMTPEYLTDLNNATPWRFFDKNTGYGSTDGNKPNIAWVSGITGTVAGSSNYRWQLAATTGNARPYFRQESKGNWSNWRTLAFTSDIPTKLSQLTDDVVAGKYLSLAGGTVNGSITIEIPSSNTSGWARGLSYKYGEETSVIAGVYGKLGLKYYYYGGSYSGGAQGLRLYGASDNYQAIFTGTVKSPTFIGNLTGNADSATKLATPRTIWGQSFDGMGNIGGSLTNVGNIYSRGAQNAGYTIYSSIRWDEALSIETTDDDGNWCALAIAVKRNGNVAIGGITSDERLHVHGNGKFTGALSSPAITTNTLKIGNVTLVEENGALKVIGGFIATGGVTSGEKAS